MRSVLLFLIFLLGYSAIEAQQKAPIHILTWNIYMRPASIFWNGQFKRAKAIGQILKDKDYDIILFQEAFGSTTRKKLRKALQGAYPFEIEPQRYKASINSGLWILSKHEIKSKEFIFFDNCLVGDCHSSKGAVFMDLEVNGLSFQLVSTHVQAEDGREFANVRAGQFKMIRTLLDSSRNTSDAQMIMGDLNTDRNNAEEYGSMLELLDAEDGEPTSDTGFPSSWDGTTNDLTPKKWHDLRQLLDYALIRRSSRPLNLKRHITVFKEKWSGKHQNLSDHYALSLTIEP